jgi:hypothetical protein
VKYEEGTGHLQLMAEWDEQNRAEAAAQTPTSAKANGQPVQARPSN